MKISRSTYLTNDQISRVKHEVLLYGAGTQSTGLLLMALNGELPSVPEFAIFADTGGEPDHVIEYKDYFTDYVKREFDFDIITVQHGNLEQDVKDYLAGKKTRVAAIPLRSKNGLLIRQCTSDYKIKPSDKYLKEFYAVRRKNEEQTGMIGLWMGISIDEMQRMKASTQWWKTILYPLIESGMRRNDTIKYVKKHGLEDPPRSACYFCPFHSAQYWRYLKQSYPHEYEKAIQFDELIRDYPKLSEQMYLHRKTVPLREIDHNQVDLLDMIDECDGYCGI